jgi:hypothetical protein
MSRVSGKTYYVYILWSPSERRFYIGISEIPVHHRRDNTTRLAATPSEDETKNARREWDVIRSRRLHPNVPR